MSSQEHTIQTSFTNAPFQYFHAEQECVTTVSVVHHVSYASQFTPLAFCLAQKHQFFKTKWVEMCLSLEHLYGYVHVSIIYSIVALTCMHVQSHFYNQHNSQRTGRKFMFVCECMYICTWQLNEFVSAPGRKRHSISPARVGSYYTHKFHFWKHFLWMSAGYYPVYIYALH